MNVAMYNSPAVKRNLEILRGFENTTVLESPAGELACGEVGQGRLMEPAEIVDYLEASDVKFRTPNSEFPIEPPAIPVAKEGRRSTRVHDRCGDRIRGTADFCKP
jgi:phosphopantothenoylcysteine decarboxylase/phosphopantothenate--cysteine ligase